MALSSVCILPVIMIKAEICTKCLNDLKITGFFLTQQSAKSKSYKISQTSFFNFFPNLESYLFQGGKTAISWNGLG